MNDGYEYNMYEYVNANKIDIVKLGYILTLAAVRLAPVYLLANSTQKSRPSSERGVVFSEFTASILNSSLIDQSI